MNQQTYWTKGRKVIYLSATFLLALTIAVGCKKKTNTLGMSALDPEALLASGGMDTFDLTTFTILENSYPTDNQPFAVLGAYNDPKMGKFNAYFYTQMHLSNAINFDAGDAPVVDSVVVSFRYKGYYGKLDPQTFEVYQLDEMLYADSTYYKYTTKQVNATNLADPAYDTQTPHPSDSVMVGDEMRPAQLRIRLNNALGQQMLDDAVAGNTAFDSDANFVNYFKGLRVNVANANPAQGTGGVFYFDLANNETSLTIYYTLNGEAEEMSLEVEASCADFNHVDIDNSGHPVEQVIADTISGANQFYTQAFQSRAAIKFPSVNDVPKNSIVHDAMLVLPVAHQTLNSYYPSVAIAVGYEDNDTIKTFRLVSYDDAMKRYVVDLRDYVQDIVTGNGENKGIYIYPLYFGSTAERIIFNGKNSTNKSKPKLIIKYTEY